MKQLRIYWRNSPSDLDVLQAVDHIRVGPDGEEVITTDKEAEVIRAMSVEFTDAFFIEYNKSLEPSKAVELILQYVPRDKAREPLQRLIAMVRKEDATAANALSKELANVLG